MALTAPRAVWLRMALLATLLVAAVVVALMIDLPSVVRLRAAVASAGVLGLAGFVLLYVGLALVPVPKNVASIAAGAAFGLGTGFVLVLAAAVLGAIVAFWLARLLGRAAVGATPARGWLEWTRRSPGTASSGWCCCGSCRWCPTPR